MTSPEKTVPTSTDLKVAELLEEAASLLANANDVEVAWFIRGIAEMIGDTEPYDQTYGPYQKHGRDAYLKVGEI